MSDQPTLPDATEPEIDTGRPATTADELRVFPEFRSLRGGCYLARWTSQASRFGGHYDGTIRVERDGLATTASGDLYLHPASWWPWGPGNHAEPDPGGGVPIFARRHYRYYLRITKVLQWMTFGNQFGLEWELHRFNRSSDTWTNLGAHSATMRWTTAPAGFPD
ncbi:MAG: hypothetical protein ACR2QO_08565, partial [Acidimicrobiales bacterium]